MKLIARRDGSPLVALRLVFRTGSAQESDGKWGVAWMAAQMLAGGGSRTRTHKEILDALFPLGVTVLSAVDKEMISFSAEIPAVEIERFYDVFRGMLLDPGWRRDDFERLREDTINYLEVGLRGQNDEELGKEILQQEIYTGHAYGRHNAGTVASLRRLKVEDLREFYVAQMARENLTLALGGGFPVGFDERVRRDFTSLPLKARGYRTPGAAREIDANELVLVEKPARGVAMSLGFPIEVTRGHDGYGALLLAAPALGQHRMSSGRLFTRMRQLRGLNYGDYAYIEHFPGGMYSLEPEPNVARRRQIFELWVRPVERGQAHFALRLALHELERLVREGLSSEEFERTRSFLSKYVNLLLKTKDAELGYAVDSDFYGIAEYPDYVRDSLARLTLDGVNQAVRRHLRFDRLKMVMVGERMEELRGAILAGEASPMIYNAEKDAALLEEDKLVERRAIDLRPDRARVIAVEEAFA